MKRLLLFFALIGACGLTFAGDATSLPGWGGDFVAAKNEAVRARKPLLLFWANSRCENCQALEQGILTDPGFAAWKATKDYVFCYHLGKDKKDQDGTVTIKDFAKSAGYTLPKGEYLRSYPFVCFWWPKRDGSIAATARSTTQVSTLMNVAESTFAGYVPLAFACDGSNAWDRYEADPGHTKYVDVALVRNGDDGDTTVYAFGYRYPGEQEYHAVSFKWLSGELKHVFRVPIPEEASDADLGKRVSVRLTVGSDIEVAATSILYVRPENGSNNPLWSNERTVETLDWGEWTADMDTATQKVAQAEGEAWTLVELAGSLWCPDCYRTDVNFLEDSVKVVGWAKKRHVALVSVDTPHNSAADPDPANPVGTIWSRDTDATKLIIPPFPDADPDKVERSGKGYLSRKMISDEDALAVARRNLWLSKDHFHRPEDYATHRTLIPIFILLDKAGNVVGRFETFDARSQSPTDRKHTEQYLVRFDEMIEMAKASADATGEVTDNHWSTTTKSVAAGSSVCNRLSHADYHDVFRIDGLKAGLVRVSLKGASAARMAVELIKIESGEATVLASGYGAVSAGVSAETEIDGRGAYYARVFCNKGGDGETTDAEFAATAETKTIFDYELSAAFELRPGVIAFDRSAVSVFEREGSVDITLSRSGGGSGTASVIVKCIAADDAAAGRYVWNNPMVTWADGEQGQKKLTFKLILDDFYADEADVTLGLVATAGCPAALSPNPMTVTIRDTTDPVLTRTAYDETAYLLFDGKISLDVYNVSDPDDVKLNVSKEFGKMPSGMKIKYDKVTGKVVISGIPKKVGDSTVAVSLTESRVEGKVTGEKTVIRLTVKDPQEKNRFVNVKRVKRTYPVYSPVDGGKVLAGTLDISISARNKIAAKYLGTTSKTLQFTGYWSGFDDTTGTATALLEKSGVVLSLSMDAGGTIFAELDVPQAYSRFAENGIARLFATCPVLQSSDFSGYAGYYTVALPSLDGSTGCGYLTLTMTSSSAIRDGKVKFLAVAPNGKSTSGSAYLMPHDDRASLSVFKRTSSFVLGADLELKPGGALNWDNPNDILAREVVNAAKDSVSYWIFGTELAFCGVAGSWYDTAATAEELVSAFYVNPLTQFRIVVGGETIGAIVADGKKFEFLPFVDGAQFKFVSKKGTFSGRSPKGNFKGVVVPGWYDNCDCGDDVPEFPFGAGAAWRTETVDGVRTVRSFELHFEEASK